jgi:hypothetical protein
MPTATATLEYKTVAFGDLTGIEAAYAAAPLPTTILTALGLLVESAVVTGADYTVTLGLVPTSPATATAALEPGVNDETEGSPVVSLTLTAGGSGYVVPPLVEFSGGQGSVPPPGGVEIPLVPAAAIAQLSLLSVTVDAGGTGYTDPVVTIVGGLTANSILTGTQATATATDVGGIITAIVVTSSGGGYTSLPKVVITDPTGSGAVATAVMQVATLAITRAGSGYCSPPTVTLVPLFKAFFPDGPNQAAPLKNLMTTGLQQSMLTQVQAVAPVIV